MILLVIGLLIGLLLGLEWIAIRSALRFSATLERIPWWIPDVCFGAFLLGLMMTLSGCWPIRVDPPLPEICPTRPTCQQCATDPNCGWSLEPSERHCFDALHPPAGAALDLIQSPEGCPEDERSELT